MNLQQSKVHSPYSFFNASHTRLQNQLVEFFQKAAQLGFIQADDPLYQTELL
ncbi:transcriptional regulator domain protein, partial [Acinetobacter baumannii 21072]